MKRLLALTIWFMMLSQIATSQVVYNYNAQWKGNEVIEALGNDSTLILNRTYSLMRGEIFVWADCDLDSMRMTYKPGSGFLTAMQMQWEKGYSVGYNDGQENSETIYEYLFWGTLASVITYAIITDIGTERKP